MQLASSATVDATLTLILTLIWILTLTLTLIPILTVILTCLEVTNPTATAPCKSGA
jgi:hypothetical protein